MTSVVCAICNTNVNTKLLYRATYAKKMFTGEIFSARRIPDRVHFQILKCRTCGLVFSNPILSPEKIIGLYKHSDFNYLSESLYLADTYANYLAKILPATGRNKLSLLDIGCGNGFFLKKAKSIGVGHIAGVEPGNLSVLKAEPNIRKYIKIDILRQGLYKENSFDIICCFQTLDHIIDPNDFLQLVYKILKKNGKILFVTHDTNGLSVKLFGEKSPIFDIEHIFLFNKITLSELFARNKFRNIKIYNLKNRFPLQFWLRQSPLPKPLKQIIIIALKFIRINNLPFSIQAGNIVAYAEK